jgi:hypothetical protein
MAITNETLFTNSYSAVKSFLNGISGLDPRGRFKANWIHSSMPNINEKGFDGYPFIILTMNIGENKPSFDVRISQKIFRVLISIYSSESTDIDNISDTLFENLKDETKLTDFQIINLESSPFSWDLDRNGKKILFRNINIVARSRI